MQKPSILYVANPFSGLEPADIIQDVWRRKAARAGQSGMLPVLVTVTVTMTMVIVSIAIIIIIIINSNIIVMYYLHCYPHLVYPTLLPYLAVTGYVPPIS